MLFSSVKSTVRLSTSPSSFEKTEDAIDVLLRPNLLRIKIQLYVFSKEVTIELNAVQEDLSSTGMLSSCSKITARSSGMWRGSRSTKNSVRKEPEANFRNSRQSSGNSLGSRGRWRSSS